MKDIKYCLRFITLMLCILFVACNDDDKEATPVFPESQKIECAVGDTKAFTFDAVSDWTLTSSALWCKFVVDGEKTYSCSGTAGKQSVTILIDGDASQLMKSYKAELTLMMGGAKQVICTVTRPVTGPELHVFDATDENLEYTAANPFGKNYGNTQELMVSANTDWVVECSEGLKLGGAVSGFAGDNIHLELTLKDGFTKNAWQGSLTFKNRAAEIISEIPVTYEGIPADKIEFSNKNPFAPIPFSADGYSYTLNSEIYWGQMPITVVAKEDQYVPVYVEYTSVYNEEIYGYEYVFNILSKDDTWFDVNEDDGAGNLSLYLSGNQGLERTAYLLIFPKVVYDAIKDNFEEKVFSTEEGIVDAYKEYIAATIKQAANASFTTGFTISDENGSPLIDNYGEKVEAWSYAQMGGILSPEELKEKYGTDNVYILSMHISIDYETIFAKPNGFTGNSVQPETFFEGVNTVWNGVKLSTGTLDWMHYDCIRIDGLKAGVTGDSPMTILCMDNENVYAVLLVERNSTTYRKHKK